MPAGTSEGFHRMPVVLFDQRIPAVEVRAPEGSTMDFELSPGGAVEDRLLQLVAEVRQVVRRRILALVRGLRVHCAGNLSDDMPHTFVWSVGDCAGLLLDLADAERPSIVVPGDPLGYQIPDLMRHLAVRGLLLDRAAGREEADRLAYRAGRHNLLVGGRSAVRFMCSFIEPTPSPEAVIESPPVCTDYSHYATLWTDGEAMEREESALGSRWLGIIQLGKALGEAHSKGVLHGDAHEGNFVIDAVEGVTVLDCSRSRLLYGPAESAECATDLLPLMRGFTAWDWYNFKRGYLQSWPDGDRVFDLIERGDRTGWMRAQRRGDYQLTLTLLDEAQHVTEVDSSAEQARLADGRAWCYYHLTDYERAMRAQQEAVARAEEAKLADLGYYLVKVALLHRETGSPEAARSTLSSFLARTDHAAQNERAVQFGRQILESLRTEPDQK